MENPEEPILYLPRHLLDVNPVLDPKSHQQKPRIFRIKNRRDDSSLSLNQPTQKSHLALGSGYRSLVAFDPKHDYVKMKGVASDGAGRLELLSAVMDFAGTANSRIVCNDLNPISPLGLYLPDEDTYLVCNLETTKKPNYETLERFVTNMRLLMPKIQLERLTNANFEKSYNKSEYISKIDSIALYQIKGDTRLDEIIYAMTFSNPDPSRKKMRNDTLQFLCYLSGHSISNLVSKGFLRYEYDDDENDNTDNHIGNIVVYPIKGKVGAGLVDFTKEKFHEESMIRLIDFEEAEKQFLELREDFFETWTFSLPFSRKFVHFNSDLRTKCGDALVVGFYDAVNRKESNTTYPKSMTSEELRFNLGKLLPANN